ncbi:MAG: EamA family transporter [Polyangiaceae bacterium]
MPAAHASALTLLEPFVAVMIGIAVFGEALTLAGAVGGILVLAGAALVVLKR